MTAEHIADLLHARHVGAGRWMAKCPAHPDRSPSLSIREGRDRRIVLLRCFAGCETRDVLKKLSLKWSAICGEPMTLAQARDAAVEREERERQQHEQRVVERAALDRLRKLHATADELGSRLANRPDAPGSDALASLFHQALDKIRQAEAAVTR
jgi:hypothetical protein